MPHARQLRGRALIFGHDAKLLETRGLLLEADGYTSDLASSLKDFKGFVASSLPYVTVVLCHTVRKDERGEIHSLLQQFHSGVSVYAMNGTASPREFLDEVSRLTGNGVILSKD